MNGKEQWLLVDNSNTRTKLMLACRDSLLPGVRMLPTTSIAEDALSRVLAGWSFSRVLVSSVVPSAAAALSRCFAQPIDFVSKDSPLPVELDYGNAGTLGADRMANAAALSARGRFPGIAVDLGTAATFDVVVTGTCRPRFIGGAIAPGLAAFASYLKGATAQLPAVELSGACPAIGRSTVEAIQSGALYGYRGLIRGLLKGIQDELGRKPYVIATGGDAALLASAMDEVDEVDPLLTFRGLHLIAYQLF